MNENQAPGTVDDAGSAHKDGSLLDKALMGGRLPSLDGLRAVSILAVMLYHSFGFMGGRLGVSTFFVLSGFLITWLLLKEFSKAGEISLKGFYYRRTLRIFPAYFCFLFVILTYEMIQDSEAVVNFILPTVFYYYNYYYPLSGEGHPALGHLWSLCVEEQFYLLWPLLFMFTAKRGNNHLLVFLLMVIVGGLLWRSYAYLELGLTEKWVYRTFDSRFDNLAIGCLLAVILHDRAGRDRLWKLLNFPKLLPVLLLALVFSRLVGIQVPTYSYTLCFTVEAVLIGLILVQCMAFSELWFVGWLNNKYVVFVGVISYAMYLYHELAAGAVDKLALYITGSFDISVSHYLVFILSFALTVGTAYVSYVFIETPMLKMKNQRGMVSATEKAD